MLKKFREEFWKIARNDTGLYAWAKNDLGNVWRTIRNRDAMSAIHNLRDISPRDVVDFMLDRGPQSHHLLNIVFYALARAEIRLSNLFIPQRSHEERLTGSFVSEMSSAILTASDRFSIEAEKLYGEGKEIDFFYYDLSRGGSLEKKTGADLAVIFHVDLPDLPEFTRYAAFQAKKIDKSTQLDKLQFRTIIREFETSACYLFYDMHLTALCPPLVIEAARWERKAKKDEKTKSFAVNRSDVLEGLPLSLWLFNRLYYAEIGTPTESLEDALRLFSVAGGQSGDLNASRLAIISIGRKLQKSINNEVGLIIS